MTLSSLWLGNRSLVVAYTTYCSTWLSGDTVTVTPVLFTIAVSCITVLIRHTFLLINLRDVPLFLFLARLLVAGG